MSSIINVDSVTPEDCPSISIEHDDRKVEMPVDSGNDGDSGDCTEHTDRAETASDFSSSVEQIMHLSTADQSPNDLLRSMAKKGDCEGLLRLLHSTDVAIQSVLDINALNEDKWTCLHDVISHGCQFHKIVAILLNEGQADPNTRDANGDTPLHSALLYHNDQNVCLLLQAGADAHVVNSVGIMPIHMVDDASTLEIFLQHARQLDLNAKDMAGNTPLHLAIMARDEDRLRVLMNSGPSRRAEIQSVNINTANNAGLTPLHVAAERDLAETLIRRGADLTTLDHSANTPLHVAVRRRHREVARLLVSKCEASTLAVANKAGQTAISLAKDKEMRRILTPSQASGGGDDCELRPLGVTRLKRKAAKSPDLAAVVVSCASDNIFCPSSDQPVEIVTRPILKVGRIMSESSEQSVDIGRTVTFSNSIDYSGVEEVKKRLKVVPVYSEMFDSDSSSASDGEHDVGDGSGMAAAAAVASAIEPSDPRSLAHDCVVNLDRIAVE